MKWKWIYLLNPARSLVDWYNSAQVSERDKELQEQGLMTWDGTPSKEAKQQSNKSILDPVIDKAEDYVDNLTGQRDVEENEKNRIFQAQQAEIARNWEEEQAKVAREWDSIGAQMERAAAAGVNPISIAMQNGGINSSATTSIPSSPGIPQGSANLMHGGALDIAKTVFSGIGAFAEQRLKMSQSDDIVAMRQYNIAEKIANTDHLRKLCEGVGLSNVAQTIQNEWLNTLNQATYDNMLADLGYKNAMSEQSRSVAKLNLQQIEQIRQDMSLDLQRFNATLPLELQLTEAEISLKNASVQQVYTEICMRHLQAIEQENRNRQSAAEAESAQLQTGIAKETYEDAIAAFHNDMVRGAAEAGVSLYDYQYYLINPKSVSQIPGRGALSIYSLFNRKMRNSWNKRDINLVLPSSFDTGLGH